jgi:hypothetical protein
MSQLTLDDAGPIGPIRNDLEEAYRAWLIHNPNIFPLFERFAREAYERGRKFSISLLTERIRWEARMTWEKDQGGFKINNNYRAYIARDLLARHPHYSEFLETRKVHDEEEDKAA